MALLLYRFCVLIGSRTLQLRCRLGLLDRLWKFHMRGGGCLNVLFDEKPQNGREQHR